MVKDYIFVSDYFSEEIQGGGELNDDELIKCLSKKNNITKVKSVNVNIDFLKQNKEKNIIISNFIFLPQQSKFFLEQNCNYVLYEHDHKYLSTRNPASYPNFLAPKESIINRSFYKNARSVFCQSSFHEEMIFKNLNLNNIENLSGNMWSDIALGLLEKYLIKEKRNKYSIMQSPINHKNTNASVLFCKYKSYNYELIKPLDYHNFLDKISNNQALVFFPKTPETLSRIVVECRMMGMKVITNNLVGATYEPWFTKKGKDLISLMKERKDIIIKKVQGSFAND
tara:strand:+ start:216 stop:1064 length:849 start_codon:yes stop_codon:yes gene_type:complete